MNSTKIDPKYISKSNPRIGLIALASDFMIEKDFINVIKDREIDFFVNRIECYNPLTKENLIKMSDKVTEVTKDILPDQDIDCVVYGCTSGTIAAGYNSIEQKVKAAKPMADVTTPSTAAIKALKDGSINKIVVTRPAVGVDDEKHGFLPGDLNSKMEPWTRPIFDVIQEYYGPKEIKTMIDESVIEISPLAFMRGRTFKNAFIIADEMQNATPNQMKMLLTRIGDDSRMAVTGDIQQTDRQESQNGLINFGNLYHKYSQSQYIQFVKFQNTDIERHPVVTEVLSIYGDK